VADPADPVAIRGLELPTRLAATLVLVRHGESTWVAEGRFQGRQDPPLSELGRRQAALVAERLAQRDEQTPLPIPTGPPTGIWHSPLDRAAETARIIAGRQLAPTELHPDERLTEIAQGEWEGELHADVRSRWPTELAAWRRTPARAHAPGGEALVSAVERVRRGLAEIVTALAPVPPAADAGGASAGAAPSDAVADGESPGYDPVPGYPAVVPRADLPPEPWALLVAHDGIFRLVLINLLGVPLERFWTFPFNLAAVSVVALHEGVAALRAHNLSDHLAPLAIEERAAQESRGERRGAL
jgi:broad specificity phosphatase PhoE